MVLKEACVGNFNEAYEAQRRGAHRIELCDNLAEGGTTPSYGTLKACKHRLDIPSMVMIRPRGGNFCYSEEEIKIMLSDIEICKTIGLEGVVFGVLTPENMIDMKQMQLLISAAKPLQVVFHMAFDQIENQSEALEQLIILGVDRVLTKGGSSSAMDGAAQIKSLLAQANGRIAILAGGGVTAGNYEEVIRLTGVTEVHGTRIV